MQALFVVVALIPVLAAPPAHEDTSQPAAQPSAEDPAYPAKEADADVATVQTERGRPYLAARSRLEAHPKAAVRAIRRALAALQGPGATDDESKRREAQRGRLLSLLGAMHEGGSVDTLVAKLHDALVTEGELEPWRTMVRDQGADAVVPLTRLVADGTIGLHLRALLLDDLVSILEPGKLGELSRQIGAGNEQLGDHLRRALGRRAASDPEAARSIGGALDAEIEKAQSASTARREARLWLARSSIARRDDTIGPRLVARAADEKAPFVVRAAALDALTHRPSVGPATADLEALARTLLGPDRTDQAAEILGGLALRALPVEKAQPIVDGLDLTTRDAPRIASRAYEVAALASTETWLPQVLDNPWPDVRRAALSRVQAPCAKGTLRTLRILAGPRSEGGDPEPTVARQAIVSLGQCGDLDGLRDLVDETGIGYDMRGEAARELVERGTRDDTDYVARRMASSEPSLGARFADALGHASHPTPAAKRALCAASEDGPLARASAGAVRALFPAEGCGEAP